jgi:hypothetical protein
LQLALHLSGYLQSVDFDIGFHLVILELIVRTFAIHLIFTALLFVFGGSGFLAWLLVVVVDVDREVLTASRSVSIVRN